MAHLEPNYTLGRGEVYFDRFVAGTRTKTGERYLGNTPEFNLTFESEKLPHYSSDRGIREKDKEVILEVARSGSLITDNIDPKNVALFFFGSLEALSVSAATIAAEAIGADGVGVELGMFYQLGASPSNPSGARKIVFPGSGGTLFTLKKGVTTLVSGTDYVVDANRGRIEILRTGSTVVDGDELEAGYSILASTRTRIISGSAPVEGALRYVEYNAVGDNIDYYFPSVSLSPNGDYALKGDEWQQIPFNIEILKSANLEALYADSQAVTA